MRFIINLDLTATILSNNGRTNMGDRTITGMNDGYL